MVRLYPPPYLCLRTLAIDKEDNVYVVHRLGNGWTIRKISAQGKITHFAGNGQQGDSGDGGPAVEAAFYTISDIATDSEGNVFVSDANKSFDSKNN